jgi:predicted CoA-binding protein
MPYGTDDEARDVLASADTWAVVGLGAGPPRTAHGVAAWLQRQGKRIVPVHPAGGEVLGERVQEDLAAVDVPVDVVDIFRRSDQAGVHVDEAIAIGARAVWLQLGVIDHDAAARARAAGLVVLMDRCPHIDGPRLLGWPG